MLINVSEFRKNQSQILAAVAAGERVVLLKHGRPVAEVVAVAPDAESLYPAGDFPQTGNTRGSS